MHNLINIIYKWQELIGAFLGASAPVSFWFFLEWQKKRDNLYFFEKIVVVNINSVIETHQTIDRFIKNQLAKLLENIDNATSYGKYSVDTAFFPLFSNPPEENIFHIHSGSGYIDNEMIRISGMAKDFSFILDDLRKQFSYTLDLHKELSVNHLNEPIPENNQFKSNINEFIRMVNEDMFEKNEKLYLKILANTLSAMEVIKKIGFLGWKLKFQADFKFFKNYNEFYKFRNSVFNRIDEYLKSSTEKKLKEYLEKMNS